MRSSRSAGGKPAALAATLLAAVLLATLVGSPAAPAAAGSAAASALGTEIGALRAELSRLIRVQEDGPAPMDGLVADALQEDLGKAESQVDSEPCAAADWLLAFAEGAREQVQVLRDRVAAGGWNATELAQLMSTLTWLDRLGRRAGTLRGRVLTETPEGDRCAGPLDLYVDADRAQPQGESLPGFEAGTNRPLASLSGSDGTSADFVADELIVSTSDPEALDSLLAQWGGTVLHTVEPDDGTAQYLVRIDTTRAEPEQMPGRLGALNGDKVKAESVAVSSRTGLELLAAASTAASAAAGDGKLTVGVNWVSVSDGFPDANTPEAVNGPSGFSVGGYHRNSYAWHYLREGGPQDIGVTGAWTVLNSVGKLDNKVKVAVLDHGFDVAVDHPSSTVLTSSIPGVSPSHQFSWNARWHGTNVMHAVAGVPGNFVGAAGPAGPVARPTGIWASGDMFVTMAAITLAVGGGNKIVIMSFRVPVPWYLSWSVLPFDAFTAFVRTVNGVLLFASAGNTGENVDGTTGWPVSWEKTWHTPCENSGVICVGGLAQNALGRHTESNYGHEDVDIFAPYVVLVGPDPDNPDASTARRKEGTSYSTPYAAGVAALIWAANPGQSASTVENVLMRNMRHSPDDKIKRRVIQALDAVQDVLPATITINTPMDEAILSPYTPTQFSASLFADGNPLPATVTWRRNGVVIGTGLQLQAHIPIGTHAITATAVFANGVSTADVVTVTSIDHVPTVTITAPTSTTMTPTFDQSELIAFHATSLDDLGALPDSRMEWYLDDATTPFATGHNPTVNTGADVGNHNITLKGCDVLNQCGQAMIPIAIQPDGTNRPPSARILNPTNGALLWVNGSDADGWYQEITLGGTASDPEGAPVTVAWLDNGVQIADTLSPTVRLRGVCGPYPHNLVLRVTDNAGITRQDQIAVTVSLIC